MYTLVGGGIRELDVPINKEQSTLELDAELRSKLSSGGRSWVQVGSALA